MLEVLEVELSRTSTGEHDYVQIRSPAAMPVNIVLIARRIMVTDARPIKAAEPVVERVRNMLMFLSASARCTDSVETLTVLEKDLRALLTFLEKNS